MTAQCAGLEIAFVFLLLQAGIAAYKLVACRDLAERIANLILLPLWALATLSVWLVL